MPGETRGCPIDHTLTAELWRENKPVQQELRAALEPVAAAVSARVVERVDQGVNIVAHNTRDTNFAPGMPLGKQYMLPADLFGEVTWRKIPQISPELPEGITSDTLVAEYQSRQAEGYNFPFWKRNTSTRTEVPDRLFWRVYNMQKEGLVIDPEKWESHMRVMQLQLRQGEYNISAINEGRQHSIEATDQRAFNKKLRDEVATGRFEYVIGAASDALKDGQEYNAAGGGYLVMPIGEYGPVCAEKVLRTTVAIINENQRTGYPIAEQSVVGHEATLQEHTARGRDQGDDYSAARAAMRITNEGTRSIMEAMALLTAEKVAGYDNHDDLVNAIVDGDLIRHFTREVPMGVVGPFIQAGVYFPGLLQNKDGKLQLNPEVMEQIKEARRQQVALFITQWRLHREGKFPLKSDGLGIVCPGAMPNGAIDQLTKAFGIAYNSSKLTEKKTAVRKHAPRLLGGVMLTRTVEPLAA